MPKKPVSMPQSRPPLERMQRIHQTLHAGGYPNATSLAVDLEVTTKTIYRDVEFMRDRLGLPIAFDVARKGYHYTEVVSAFPTFQITEGELFALIVAEKALQQYRGTSFEKPLLSAIRKMAQALPDTISLNLADVEQTISFRTTAEPILNLGVFDVLAKATAARRQLGWLTASPARARRTGASWTRITSRTSTGSGSCSRSITGGRMCGRSRRRASRQCGRRARPLRSRRSSRWRSGCATASACIRRRGV